MGVWSINQNKSFCKHQWLLTNRLCIGTIRNGQHSGISPRYSRFNSLHGPTYFQNLFFSFSSFWGHQTFLFKISNLKNHLSFNGSKGRVISHIKGLPLKLTYYYRAFRKGLTDRNVDIHLDGGKLSIEWSEDGVWMTGPTTIVFKGTLSAEFLKAVQWQHQSLWLKVAD